MDLGKIIAQLRSELQCLDAVIVSMEALARVQSLTDSLPGEEFPPENPPDEEPPPARKRRGRQRPQDTPDAGPMEDQTSSAAPSGSEPADDGEPPESRNSTAATAVSAA